MTTKQVGTSVGNSNGTANGKPHTNGKVNGRSPTATATGSISSNGSSNDLLHQEEVDPSPEQVGYEWSLIKSLFLYPVAALPLGAGLLFAYWFPHVWIKLTCWKCPLPKATYVIVKDLDGKYRVERVHRVELPTTSLGVQGDAPVVEESDEDETVLLMPQTQILKYFEHRHLRYIYTDEVGKFVLLKNYDHENSCLSIHDLSCGLTAVEHKEKLTYHGPNSIDVPVKPYHVLFIEEVLHPFYIFQILATIFWIADTYYFYASVVFLISTVSVLISLVQTRRHRKQLHDMVVSSSNVTVFRDGKEHDNIPSEDLVPGDVLVIPPKGMSMPCDAALLSGHAIVNEAMLTGESVPVTKTPLPQEAAMYSPDRYKRHTLFCGTHVIQTRFYANTPVTAVVIRTGFSTSKGGMVRSILFPKPLNMKFYADALKFVLVLSLIAFGGLVYTLTILQLKHYQVKETILRALDVITIVVPPALPAALTVGTVYALNRLRKQKIYCISPQRVNLCGKVKLVCFDKTGTLTEDSLDLYGVRPATGGLFAPFVTDPCCLTPGPMVYGMASCHSLTTIEGVLTGDPLDLKMFNGTQWLLEEPGEDSSRFDSVVPTIVRPPPSSSHLFESGEPVELGIMKQFTFSSEIQRMSVLVRALPCKDPKLLYAYVKGAPETIKRLCVPETVPRDFHEVLSSLTQQGYRVLALGYKTMHMPWHKAERLHRDMVECDLTFAGLIVMQNRLKPETSPVIQTLIKANIRTVMITGDNLLTAVSVARECMMIPSQSRAVVIKATLASSKMPQLTYHPVGETDDQIHLLRSHSSTSVEPHLSPSEQEGVAPLLYQDDLEPPLGGAYHLAIDGKSFAVIREHCPEVMEKLLVKGTVFARMSPDQKAQLVTALMDIGYGVAMCGDGANDCGALKAAHAGISLSETEASVASPFTSKEANITCVPNVIREGRAALVTSFSAFKYMALYSIAEFISAAILYTYESNLGDFQYLYIDLVLVLAFAFVMGFTGPYPRLVRQRPPGTLAGIHVLMSLIVQALLLLVFQVGALFYLTSQSWYKPPVEDADGENILSSVNTTIFQISIFQYIGLVVALSTAAPFRKSFLSNYWFVLCLVILFPINVYLTMAPQSWWPWFWARLELKPHPDIYFKIGLVLLALNHCVLAYFLEGYVFPSEWMRKFLRFVRCKRRPNNRYKHILASIPPHWPPITPSDRLN